MVDVNLSAVMVAYYMRRELGKFLDERKAELNRLLGLGDSVSARFDLDGQELPLGKATRTEPRPQWKLTDPEELLEWAKVSAPEMTETVTVLREEAVKELLDMVKHQNGAFTPEGEVIPGITWDNTGGSYIRFTPVKDMPEKLSLLNREGRLSGLTDGLLGLGNDSAAD